MNNPFFKLYACCIPVLGANRSTICDIQRSDFFFIPNILFEILTEHNNKLISDIKKVYNNEADEIIDEYFDFLIEKELGFFTMEPELFPPLDNKWKTPSTISNAIIDMDDSSQHDFLKISRELDKLNCKAIELRCYTEKNIEELNNILDSFKDSRLQNIVLIIKNSKQLNRTMLKNIISNHVRVSAIVLHSSDRNFIHKRITYTKQKVNSSLHCGVIQTNYFSVNIDTFFESLNHNSCLNKKISIDIDGNIKNCPSMTESFGNIADTSLEEALDKEDFKKYWNITKDEIEVCKDCEFRYVCTDCRAYKEDPENDLSKPLKCGYSPYTNEWEEWTTNPIKLKAIEYYSLQK